MQEMIFKVPSNPYHSNTQIVMSQEVCLAQDTCNKFEQKIDILIFSPVDLEFN